MLHEALRERRNDVPGLASDYNAINLFSGDCYVSNSPNDVMITILGSCISACICDPVARVGGMNHFLLPGDGSLSDTMNMGAATRYGVFAMEKLINGILSAGGRKDRLEIKMFGGGNVINNSMRIGSKNVAFVHGFLAKEGLPIHSEDMEGDLPRRIHYFPTTGKAMMRKLHRKEDMKVIDQEVRYQQKISAQPLEGTIDLF